MAVTNTNLALFEQVKSLASVDFVQASSLAKTAQLIVRTWEGQYGVLDEVTWRGEAVVLVAQRSRSLTLRFDQVEATGHVWEPA